MENRIGELSSGYTFSVPDHSPKNQEPHDHSQRSWGAGYKVSTEENPQKYCHACCSPQIHSSERTIKTLEGVRAELKKEASSQSEHLKAQLRAKAESAGKPLAQEKWSGTVTTQITGDGVPPNTYVGVTMSTIETIETGQITINDEELSKFMNLLVSAWSDPEQLFLDFSDLSTPSSKENSRGFSQLYDNLKLVAADANILGAKQVKSADSIYSSKGLNDEAKAFQLLRSIRTSICSNPENSSRQKQCEAMVEALRSISDDYNRSMDEMVKEAFE